MKRALMIAVGASFLGLASFSAPAAAFPSTGLHTAQGLIQIVDYRRHRHCRVRKVVKRDRFGHRVSGPSASVTAEVDTADLTNKKGPRFENPVARPKS